MKRRLPKKRKLAYAEFGMEASTPKLSKMGMIPDKTIKRMRKKRGLK